MRCDYMFTVWTEANTRPYHEAIAEYVEQTRLAEQAGFEGVWIGEHHFQEEGFDVVPNPVLLAGHLATHTERIRIGLGAVTLPTWHPLRAAEDIATLDHLSGGRVDCAWSRGIDPRDIMNLNPAANRADEERSLGLFTESIEIVRRAWTEDALAFEGEHFTIPYPGLKVRPMPWYRQDPRRAAADGTQVALNVVPKPLQHPHPPLYLVSESPSGYRMAAANGMRAVTWLPCRQRLTDLVAVYRDAAAEAGEDLRLGERTGLLRPCLVAPTMEEARRATERAVENMAGAMTSGPRGRAAFSGGPDDSDDGSLDIFDYLYERDHLLIGTPAAVTEQILRLGEQHGIDHLLIWMPFYGVEHKDVMRSLELFGEHVLPAVSAQATRA